MKEIVLIKYTTEWFKKRFKESHPDDYEDYIVESEYKNSHTKISMYHKKCGSHFEITPNSFISGRGCLLCGHANAAKAQMKTKEEVNNSFPDGITLVGEYTGVLKKAEVYCSICNNKYYIRPHDLIKRQQCPFCSGYNRETTDTFKKYLIESTKGEYSLIGEYNKANTHVNMRHNTCGTEYLVTPHNFKHGRRCPKCRQSIGERLLANILTDEDITFIPQKKFEGCKDKNPLSYDFYLPDYNMLIEYQGEQHYHPVELFGGSKKFDIQKRHDKFKREFANSNGIVLVEISYKHGDYDSIKSFLDARINEILGN